MPICFFNEGIEYNLKEKNRLKRWIRGVIEKEKMQIGQVNIIFTTNNKILQINKEYLSHDYYTDIITFNYCDKEIVNGDIYISLDTVRNNSAYYGVKMIEELYRVIIHGILHLIGYNDQNKGESVIMREKETYYLERLKNLL